jgi:hypothetical protein
MELVLALVLGLVLGSGITLIGQFTVSTGLLGRKPQQPPAKTP